MVLDVLFRYIQMTVFSHSAIWEGHAHKCRPIFRPFVPAAFAMSRYSQNTVTIRIGIIASGALHARTDQYEASFPHQLRSAIAGVKRRDLYERH